MFKRMTSAPLAMSSAMISGLSVAGPRVQRILVLRMEVGNPSIGQNAVPIKRGKHRQKCEKLQGPASPVPPAAEPNWITTSRSNGWLPEAYAQAKRPTCQPSAAAMTPTTTLPKAFSSARVVFPPSKRTQELFASVEKVV